MNECPMEKVYLYSRFERFWHWAQGALIMFLALSGFELHGNGGMMGFQTAAEWHNRAGIAWLVLYAFIIFWQLTTGEWKHYIPTTRKLMAVVRYYVWGIFAGEPHPVPKSSRNKHNPLQRLTYLSITVVLIPFQVCTGLLYYTYPSWSQSQGAMGLGALAGLHTAGAFGLVAFLVVHIYMVTTGHTMTAHLKAMCTGWEEVPANGAAEEELKEAA
ncbi:MAG: cytochrome b/b6 domain-containing protein [Syntrophobacteraceae bacterium]